MAPDPAATAQRRPPPPPWHKRLRRRIRSALLRALVRLLARLPLPAALWLGRAGGALAFRLSARDRRRALAQLAMAFPDKTERERLAVARASFSHLGVAVMEVVAVRRLDARLDEYVRIDPRAERLMREARAAGRGFVFATGHLGNWELLARRVARAGFECVVVARRSWDRRIDDFIAAFRASGGVATLWREDPSAGRGLLKTLRQGKSLGILIDQDTRVQGVFVPFFGRPAFTPRAAADLALRFRAPLFVGWSRRLGPAPAAGYVIECEPVPFDPDPPDPDAEAIRMTAACVARLERVIRDNPIEWVWMHERWKTRPAEEGVSFG